MITSRAAPALLAAAAFTLASCSNNSSSGDDKSVCLEQSAGQTSDGDAVTVCQKIFAEAPFVRLPADDTASSTATINGAVELDIHEDPDHPGVWIIPQARFIDRNHKTYILLNPDGTPANQQSPAMASNHLPSNRVHFLLYEAKGTVSGDQFKLQSLKPIVMVTGHAIDERFLGAWEGTMSLYTGDHTWTPEETNAKVRVEVTGLVPFTPIPQISETITPPLADGTRFKAAGGVANMDTKVKLSTGECIPSLKSLGSSNPLFEAKDTVLTLFRFPAMHSADSKDFHVVLDYPRNLYENPTTQAMAEDHNFRLADYISPATAPKDLRFVLHGNPVQQIVIHLKPVTGGGGAC